MLPDSLTLLKQAWEIYRKRLLVFLGIMAFPFFAPSLLVSVFAGRILGFRTESLTSLSFGILLIVVALIAISFFHPFMELGCVAPRYPRQGRKYRD